ncbi:MAG: hydroxyquinol 1,2-dioxygenase [Actinomycetota bacterium]
MTNYTTAFGTLTDYEKGRVDIVDDDPKYYAFSNVFEVANMSAPYEKVAVAKNLEYVIEAIRAEGTSEWRATPHDEFALVMDGQVTIELLDPAETVVDPDANGSIAIDGDPSGTPMGSIVAGRGHMALLPAGKAYRFAASSPSVVLLQTIEGADTVFKWGEICQTL